MKYGNFSHLPKEGYYWICQRRRGLFAKKLNPSKLLNRIDLVLRSLFRYT